MKNRPLWVKPLVVNVVIGLILAVPTLIRLDQYVAARYVEQWQCETDAFYALSRSSVEPVGRLIRAGKTRDDRMVLVKAAKHQVIVSLKERYQALRKLPDSPSCEVLSRATLRHMAFMINWMIEAENLSDAKLYALAKTDLRLRAEVAREARKFGRTYRPLEEIRQNVAEPIRTL